jgi:hypothetical protein
MDRDTTILQVLKEEQQRGSLGGSGSVYSSGAGTATTMPSSGMREPVYDAPGRRPGVHRWLDSFRRDPERRITPKSVSMALGLPTREIRGQPYYDLRSANFATAHSGLSRELKGRHLQMIAIGGSIGELTLSSASFLSSDTERPVISVRIGSLFGQGGEGGAISPYHRLPRHRVRPREQAVACSVIGADHSLTRKSRHRLVRRLRQGASTRRACLRPDRLLLHRHHAVLHSPCPRRAGGDVPGSRLLFRFLDPIS